jgi:hypothetical protein
MVPWQDRKNHSLPLNFLSATSCTSQAKNPGKILLVRLVNITLKPFHGVGEDEKHPAANDTRSASPAGNAEPLPP